MNTRFVIAAAAAALPSVVMAQDASQTPLDTLMTWMPFILEGFTLNLLMSVLAMALATVLGIILGTMLDTNLRRALTLGDGDLTPFFTRPISAVLFGLILIAILSNFRFVRNGFASLRDSILRRRDA